MKVEVLNGSRERVVLSAMITNNTVLSSIAARWGEEMFSAYWCNLIGQWCVAYYKKHNTAPGKAITGLFSQWAERQDDRETILLVDRFLSSMSQEHDPDNVNPSYVIEQAGLIFDEARIKRILSAAEGHLSMGDVTKARESIERFTRVGLGETTWSDIFQDYGKAPLTFDGMDEDIVTYKGALGTFFRGQLCRDAFVSFMGPEKAGKSFFLMDFAIRAACQRRRVAFFEVGDMSMKQVLRRIYCRVAQHPYRSTAKQGDPKWPCTIDCPVSIKPAHEPAEDGTWPAPEIKTRTYTYKQPLDAAISWKACQDLIRREIRSNDSYLRLSCHPNVSINVQGIKSILQLWEGQGWIADVVVIDYADILAPCDGRLDYRNQVNQTWQQLRSLSTERHVLLVTATQADAESYGKSILDMRNFSEDKRKLSHVTALVGINATAREKKVGACRLNYIVTREGEGDSRRCVHVAQCLPLANPTACSSF